MKVDMQNGQPVVDAEDIAELLDLSPSDVHAKMRNAEITSRFETGVGEDAGRVRLTFFYKTMKVRLTCTTDGTVLKTLRIDTGGRK